MFIFGLSRVYELLSFFGSVPNLGQVVSELRVCSESKCELDDVDQALKGIPLLHQQCSFCNIVQKRRSVEHMLKNIDVKAFWQHNNDLKRLFKGRIVKILGHI